MTDSTTKTVVIVDDGQDGREEFAELFRRSTKSGIDAKVITTEDTVMRNLGVALLVVDNTLRITLQNDSVGEIFDLPEERAGLMITSVPTRTEVPALRHRILHVTQSGEILSRQLEGGEVSYIERILPYRNEVGDIEGAVLSYINNTVSCRTERKLSASEERYKFAVDGSGLGLWDWQIESNELYCSPKLLEILQIKQYNKKAGMAFFKERVHPDDVRDVISALDAHLEKGFDFNVECRMRRGELALDQSSDLAAPYLWIQIRGQAIWNDARIALRLSGSLNDYTDQRTTIDELKASNQALGRFAYICSHDLKEPARLANNFATLLSEHSRDRLDTDEAEYVEQILQNTEHMQDMIKDMLTYSQVENKGAMLEEVDCAVEFDRVLEHLQFAISESNARVSRESLPIVRADRMQIFQLLLNLISNAIKFQSDHKPEVKVVATQENGDWKFAVSDNGIGMKMSHAPNIFKEFQRLNNSDDYPGTGIGLSICQKIVQQHRGKIWLTSKPNEGSTFYFTIPKKLIGR